MNEPIKHNKPLFIVLPGSMTAKDIRRAEKMAGVVIVENKNPEQVRFLELPIAAALDIEAYASMAVMRIIMNHQDTSFQRGSITKWFVDTIMNAARPKTVAQVKKP